MLTPDGPLQYTSLWKQTRGLSASPAAFTCCVSMKLLHDPSQGTADFLTESANAGGEELALNCERFQLI